MGAIEEGGTCPIFLKHRRRRLSNSVLHFTYIRLKNEKEESSEFKGLLGLHFMIEISGGKKASGESKINCQDHISSLVFTHICYLACFDN